MQSVSMFTKFWEPGFVKTRLAQSIGDENAARLYRVFVHYLASRLNNVGDLRSFIVSPDSKAEDFKKIDGLDWEAVGQGDGDLGERLRRHYWNVLKKDLKVVVIGGDCLEITPELVRSAFDNLEENDAVIGPSYDGGYYLLGLRGPWRDNHRCLFEDMDWGTESVFGVTLDRMKSIMGIEPVILEKHRDIDTLEDLKDFLSNSINLDSSLRESIDQILADVSPSGDHD